jgi:hypothetical protein
MSHGSKVITLLTTCLNDCNCLSLKIVLLFYKHPLENIGMWLLKTESYYVEVLLVYLSLSN